MAEFNFDYDTLATKLLEKLAGKTTDINLECYCEEVLGYVKRNRSKKTFEGAKLVCNKLMNYFSPLRRIATIKQKDAEDWLDYEKKTAKKAFRNYHRIARAIFNKAIEWNYLRENCFAKIKLAKTQQNQPDYLTETELNTTCRYISNKTIQDAVRFAYYTGVRLGELVNIKWSNIDLEKKTLIVGDDNWTTKGKKQRIVPLSEKTLRVLRGRVPQSYAIVKKFDERFVFAKPNGMQYTTDCLSKNFKRAVRKAGIDERIHFHSLRHSAASMMAKNGAPITAVKEILGHSSISTTMIYIRSNLETLRDAINRI